MHQLQWLWLLVNGWDTFNGVGWLLWLRLLSGVNVDIDVIQTALVVVLLIGFYGWDIVRRARLLLLQVKLS
ncbi:hypothetical protein KSD_95970 [Ktedonobacter sp. SOSP1-85]|uniref:hypothetical protein n=1 Tax=Ktedonobacter sp. SOSP1-85 TaxID=2778367 RepID=UPI0019155894|nr:hypothetical protein [Ktedonobacter sp. SOSP1-85]GHO81826.1 hypothetical protein KSD_95970 [Ktedonobacter sp. SOSP1-85]